MKNLRFVLSMACLLLFLPVISAQSGLSVKLKLVDATSGEPVGFATVSLQAQGAKKPAAYALSSEKGEASLSGFRAGTYTLKAELLGYKTVTKEITVKAALDLGELKMATDNQQLDAATVSATGNAILIKKDTIEYNASSYKTTENDVLEDLLKKLPGVDIGEDGSISVNGETITKITIEGKTFFLDDPQLASKNLPAKMINKLKVIRKKSEQAEFTGIDDGEEETVIDLGVKKEMMKGVFGNIMGGVGHDLSPDKEVAGDVRYHGAEFAGKFTDKTQISIVANANNTNNRGFNDLSGSMMGNMRGGRGMGRGSGGFGGGNGITTSYMGGVNGAFSLFDNKMDLSGNYLYNYTDRDVEESSQKRTYLEDSDLIYNTEGASNSVSDGHRLGVRLEHKFSENTSILFEPQLNFGTGRFTEASNDSTYSDDHAGNISRLNDAYSLSSGENRNISTSGFLLFRQRLGIPGRTISAMVRYSFSNNVLEGLNRNGTTTYNADGTSDKTGVNQTYDSDQNSSSINGRVTYTEPMGDNFYLEGNYSYRWARSSSDKTTLNEDGSQDYTLSNSIINESVTQSFGANVLYQKSKIRAQVGFTAEPNHTFNSTTKYNSVSGTYEPMIYDPGVIWNFAPQAMGFWEIRDGANLHLFYRGRTAQPSTSKLMPVPDNSDPLDISFGNPSLSPYFTHSLRSDIRISNRQKFSSCNIGIEGGYTKDPIVNMIWYGNGGAQYSMPFNGPDSYNISVNSFANIPFGKSNFSMANVTRVSFSHSASYVGTDIDMGKYDSEGYYEFMDWFIEQFNDGDYFDRHISENRTNSMTLVERIRLNYRSDNLEIQIGPRTRMNRSWYDVGGKSSITTTWSNQIRASLNWTVAPIGMTFKSDINYNWYNGYSTNPEPELVMNAELSQPVFKKKATIAIKAYDIFGQSRNVSVSDDANFHKESINNTLGRYIMASITWRFGTFDRSKMRGGMGGGPRGPHGPGPRR